MYTLSSPTVLAADAAVHPRAVPVLRALGASFRITQDGALALAQAWHDRDEKAHEVGWILVSLLDLNTPTLPRALLRPPSDGAGVTAGDLMRRFGTSSQLAALVAAESAVWPDAPVARIPGAGLVPASAAVAAASVAALWAAPELPASQVACLRAPFEAAQTAHELFETGPLPYGPGSEGILDLIGLLSAGQISPAGLRRITWPPGVWAGAMHAGAWVCLRQGRLRAQLRAVIDVTLAFVLANPGLAPIDVRTSLPALHALTVRRLVADAEDGTAALGELALAELAL